MARWMDEHIHYTSGNREKISVGDWIKITWMAGEPEAEVIGKDEHGWPIVEHPVTPGIGPMTVDVYDLVCRKDDPVLFMGMWI